MQEGGSENKRVKETDVMDSSDGGRTRKKKEKGIFHLPYLFFLTYDEFPMTVFLRIAMVRCT